MNIQKLILRKSKEKKNIFLFLILLFLFLIIFVALTMIKFTIDFKRDTYTKNVLMRTLWVSKDDNDTLDYDVINGLNHVVLNVSNKFLNSTIHKVPEFDNGEMKGKVEIYPLLDKNDIKIINGKNIENDNEAVCPEKFYPHGKYVGSEENNDITLKIINSKFLRGKDIIGKSFYLSSIDIEKKDNPDTIKVKIVGTYDTADNMTTLNSCYISQKSFDIIAPPYGSCVTSTYQDGRVERECNMFIDRIVRVDNYKNLDVVAKQIKDLGFSVTYCYEFEEWAVDLIFYIPLMISIVTILVALGLIYNFINKKIRYERKYFGIMTVLGYDKMKLKEMEVLEDIIVSLVAFGLSIIIYLTAYFIITKFFLEEFTYNSVNIAIPILWFLVFIIVFLAILSVIIKNIMEKNFKNSVSDMLKKD